MKSKFSIEGTKVYAAIHVDDACLSDLGDNLDNETDLEYTIEGEYVLVSFDVDDYSVDSFATVLINSTSSFDLADEFEAFLVVNQIG